MVSIEKSKLPSLVSVMIIVCRFVYVVNESFVSGREKEACRLLRSPW